MRVRRCPIYKVLYILYSGKYPNSHSERIERASIKLDVRAVFKFSKTLRSHLCRVKGKQQLDRVIYNIPCTCGREYIGETGRSYEGSKNEFVFYCFPHVLAQSGDLTVDKPYQNAACLSSNGTNFMLPKFADPLHCGLQMASDPIIL